MALIFVFLVASSFTAAFAAPQERLPTQPPPHQSPEDERIAPRPATDLTVWELFNVSDPGPEFREERRKIASNHSYASYLQNDIVVPEGFNRAGFIDNAYRWPGGVIPVYIDPYWGPKEREIILAGFEKITTTTCIRFVPYDRSQHGNFVRLEPWLDEGCRAVIGMNYDPTGEGQWVRMDPRGCIVEGTVAHEFIHTIGFWHEHQRPDRDDWVTVQFDNIPTERWHDFQKPDGVKTFGTPYDYGSIMHYPANLPWAINPKQPIFVSKTRTPVAGQEHHLTALDIQKIQNMYKGICN